MNNPPQLPEDLDQIREHRKKRAKLWKQFWILLAIFLLLGTGVYIYLGMKGIN